MLSAATGLTPVATAHGTGFDRAIETASARVVRLHGLGAGIQEGYGTEVVVSQDDARARRHVSCPLGGGSDGRLPNNRL